MTYYIIVLVFLLFCFAFDNSRRRINNQKINGIVLISFLLLLMLRTFVKIDSLPDLTYYQRLFEESSHYNLDNLYIEASLREVEPGFLLLTRVCRFLFEDFHFELFIIGLIVLYSYYKVILKYSDFFWLSILVFFISVYPNSTYILRQYIAMALLFASTPFIIERKLVPFIIIMVIAFFFHISSIVWIPIYFAYGIRSNKVLIFLLLFFVIVLSVYDNLASQVINVLGNEYEKYESYVEGHKVLNSYWGAIANTLYLLVYVLVCRKRSFNDGINRFVFLVAFISTVLSWISINGTGLMFRLIVYFSQINILLIPLIITNVKDNATRYILTIVFLLVNIIPNYLVDRGFHLHQVDYSNLALVITSIIVTFAGYAFIKTSARNRGKFRIVS